MTTGSTSHWYSPSPGQAWNDASKVDAAKKKKIKAYHGYIQKEIMPQYAKDG